MPRRASSLIPLPSRLVTSTRTAVSPTPPRPRRADLKPFSIIAAALTIAKLPSTRCRRWYDEPEPSASLGIWISVSSSPNSRSVCINPFKKLCISTTRSPFALWSLIYAPITSTYGDLNGDADYRKAMTRIYAQRVMKTAAAKMS
jgi:hypothetical protein